MNLPSPDASPTPRRASPRRPFPQRPAAPADGILARLKLTWAVLFRKPSNTVPDQPIPVRPLTRAELGAAPDRSLFRLGHSTILLKLRGRYWITDPVFSSAPRRCNGPAALSRAAHRARRPAADRRRDPFPQPL
ncbi:hypothetical protein WJ972_06310 [Achromobacter insuavis]